MQIDIKRAAILLGGDDYSGNRVLCPGPGHSKHDRSLSVTFNADGTFTTNSFAEDDFRDCRDHVKARLGYSDARPIVHVAPFPDLSGLIDVQRRIDDARRIWESCEPLKGTLAEVYLESRGLSYDGDALAFRPTCRSMVALMTDALTGEPCGVHRTFLDAEGRKIDKKMRGRAKGAVVRLYDLEAPFGLGIAEGIETALATDFRPTWAGLTAGGVASLPVLPHVEALTVFADHDRAGIQAANTVGERWHAAGREVTLVMPADAGRDFADREAA
ncbi:toprim domain-containing protein [Rhizobium sp. CCGE 510]|uniref:DUF7146 domain-containing protein n=1 Tax=Rhizobium sp. CCGE 510 TaxID=1132836 RepID=UPI00027B7E33|nr:toprim domain-containing protein [Rhizobium sp. CCGE 510]EJT05701.1 hypothetical protein RCCGE510_07231 [Rhizobium sp. CCGE 510]